MENGHLAGGGADFAIGEHNRPPIRSIALDDIRIDEGVQARVQIVAEVVDEYAAAMQEGDEFPPLAVFQESDTFILADGFTRHAAAKRAGWTDINCVVRAGGMRDAMLFAAGANATHGRPRSIADKHRAVLKLLNDDEWRMWSDREIARRCHVSHQLVAELREFTGRATSERKFPSKHGGAGKMKIGKIGKSSKRKSRSAANSRGPEPQQLELPDQRKVDADQHVQEDQSLAVLIEFAKFILPRIADQADTTVITVTAEDVNEFNVLADRVRSVINQKS
jgi:ParB-like chromosome segregation protein Spo0J